jgi:hypothetical protein
MLNWFLNCFWPKSPCCDYRMTSCLEMEWDKLLYECPKCGKEYM